MPWTSVKVKARLKVGDAEFDVVSAAIAFELNGIPRATFGVEMGRKLNSLEPAAIHSFDPPPGKPLRVEFFVTLQYVAGQKQRLPAGEFKLFDGYFAGISWQRGTGKAAAVINAKHWLLDMDYSSSLSDMSHPTNPSQFSYRVTHQWQGAGGSESWTPFTQQGLITPTVIADDFWQKGLYPWLQELTQQDLINTDELTFLGTAGSNSTAKQALDRFSFGPGNYAKLAFDLRGADAQSVADALWNDVQLETFASFTNVTLWGKLVGDFASRYMFAVVPRVEDALVVPFVPGLRQTWRYSMSADDFDFIGSTSEVMRTLRGVGVFAGLKSRTNADVHEPGEDSRRLGIGGWYSPQGVETGMIMLKQGPRWLTNIIATDRYAEFGSGAGAKPIGTALHPGAGDGAGGPPQPAELKQSSKRIFDSFAESLYVYEQLRLRQIEISGKARFDIAPGSTISVEVVGDEFIQSDVLARKLVGDVMRVTYLIDAENGKIATNFNLAHVRTEAQNQQEGYSLPKHPLWTNPWPGAGLLSEFDS